MVVRVPGFVGVCDGGRGSRAVGGLAGSRESTYYSVGNERLEVIMYDGKLAVQSASPSWESGLVSRLAGRHHWRPALKRDKMLDQLPVIATNSRHLASRAGVPALSLVLPWLAAMYACMLACCWARFEWTLGTFGRVSPFESRFPPFCLSKESGD